ncbi:MAG TPA: endo-1,4-beta-xylanase [Stellaceae bacterium]|nr:endo-1,4-beta-xylanase [Stellaceae bacterium]
MTPNVTRRDLLRAAAGSAMLAAAPARAATEGGQGLGAIAAERGLLFGSWIRETSLFDNPAYAEMMARECRLIVSALEMHWDSVEPEQGVDDFKLPDAALGWAKAHGQKFRGHALVWGERAPKWFASLSGRDAAIRALRDHIRRVCGHFAGQMQSWDVVNEAIQTYSGRPDKLRRTVFLDKIGPEYLDIAFTAAREADPHALLVLNEFGVEFEIEDSAEKRATLLGLVDGFKKRGTPIDAIGVQSHLQTRWMPHFDPRAFGAFLDEIAGRGLKILLTELDVADRSAPSDIAVRDAEVAATYKRYLDAALAHQAVIAAITWGLTDGDSWVTRGDLPAFRRTDGLPPRPLPFDQNYRPKPAYFAIAEALHAAPMRRPD